MKADWYCLIQDETVGPLHDEQLREMARLGTLGPNDLVCKGGSGRWVSASDIKGLFSHEYSQAATVKHAAPAPARRVPEVRPAPSVRAVESQSVPEVKPVPSVQPAPEVRPVGRAVTPAAKPTKRSEQASAVHTRHLRNRHRQRNSFWAISIIIGGFAATVLAMVFVLAWKTDETSEQANAGTEFDNRQPSNRTKSKKNSRQKLAKSNQRRSPRRNRYPDASRSRGRVGDVQFQVVSAWLEGEGETAKLCFEIEVQNSSPKRPIRFFGWNKIDEQHPAPELVMGNAEEGMGPVAFHATPTEQGDLSPRESSSEVLRFDKPSSLDNLRLRLPFSAFGKTGDYVFAIPKVMVLDRPAAAVAGKQNEGAPAGAGDDNMSDVEIANGAIGSAVAPAPTKKSDAKDMGKGVLPNKDVFAEGAGLRKRRRKATNGDQPTSIGQLQRSIDAKKDAMKEKEVDKDKMKEMPKK